MHREQDEIAILEIEILLNGKIEGKISKENRKDYQNNIIYSNNRYKKKFESSKILIHIIKKMENLVCYYIRNDLAKGK